MAICVERRYRRRVARPPISTMDINHVRRRECGGSRGWIVGRYVCLHSRSSRRSCRWSFGNTDRMVRSETQSRQPAIRAYPCAEGTAGRMEDPEARTASFKLYEAACLLVGEEPEWPLSTRKSREEYNTLCHAVKTDRLDSNDDSPAFMFGYVLDNDEVHLLELDRKTLRRYLSFQNRPVPDFLLEKFDEHALPPDADKDTGDES